MYEISVSRAFLVLSAVPGTKVSHISNEPINIFNCTPYRLLLKRFPLQQCQPPIPSTSNLKRWTGIMDVGRGRAAQKSSPGRALPTDVDGVLEELVKLARYVRM